MIEITSLDHNGRGIGKLNNKIVFVENALPGEIVDITILKEKKKYIEARVNNFIKKSEKRIESVCPYFAECGGCDLLHLSYKDTLNFKEDDSKQNSAALINYCFFTAVSDNCPIGHHKLRKQFHIKFF